MKGILPYILVFAATFLLSGVVVFGTLMLRPDLLHGSATAEQPVDSAAIRNAPRYLREYAGPTPSELTPLRTGSTDSVALYRDSILVLQTALNAEQSKDHTLAGETRRDTVIAPAVATDSLKAKQQKAKAKLLEAMPPESAAKILANLPDDETKDLLKYMKARQAAKILAAIQPDRASKLFR
jgi:hypothetical protein